MRRLFFCAQQTATIRTHTDVLCGLVCTDSSFVTLAGPPLSLPSGKSRLVSFEFFLRWETTVMGCSNHKIKCNPTGPPITPKSPVRIINSWNKMALDLVLGTMDTCVGRLSSFPRVQIEEWPDLALITHLAPSGLNYIVYGH